MATKMTKEPQVGEAVRTLEVAKDVLAAAHELGEGGCSEQEHHGLVMLVEGVMNRAIGLLGYAETTPADIQSPSVGR